MPKRWLTQNVGAEGGGSTEEAKIKKGHAPKAGAKTAPNSATPVGGACSFSAFSILPMRLHDCHRATPIPQIQTNSSGSYRRSNKCRTFTFSSEGSATVSPPPPSRTTLLCPLLQSPRFSTMSLFHQFTFASSLAYPLADRAR